MAGDIIEHTISLRIPDSLWPDAKKAFRALRQLHQEAGGTSRLVKNGETLTFSAKGPSVSVLDAIKNAKRIQAKVDETRESTVDYLRDVLRGAESRREQRKEEFLGMVADEMLRQRKDKQRKP